MIAQDRDQLRFLVAAAIAAEAAVDRLCDPEAMASEEADLAVMTADRRARDELTLALAALGGTEPVAVRLADGTIAVRTVDLDGLAVIRPDRVFRLEGPP